MPPVWRLIQRVADSKVPAFEREVLHAFGVGRSALDVTAVDRAFAERSDKEVEYHVMIAVAAALAVMGTELPRVLEDTLDAGGQTAAREARTRGFQLRPAKVVQDLHFDLVNPEAVRWAKQASSKLIANISKETREAIRVIIMRAFTEGIPVDQLTRMLMPMIGLTDQSTHAVLNLRRAMIGYKDIQGRMIGGPGRKIWAGKTAIRVPLEGASQELILKRMREYSGRLLRQRARMIARTETIGASNEGQRLLWKQAVGRGLLNEDMGREWITTPDERLCYICESLHGEVVGLDEPFSVGVIGPPAHVGCRCCTGLTRKPVPHPHPLTYLMPEGYAA